MSDTPRTDAQVYSLPEFDSGAGVCADFARQLERELTAAKRNEAVCHCGDLVSQHHHGSGHSPVPMEEECPYAARLGESERALRFAADCLETVSDSNTEHWPSEKSRDDYAKEAAATVRSSIAEKPAIHCLNDLPGGGLDS